MGRYEKWMYEYDNGSQIKGDLTTAWRLVSFQDNVMDFQYLAVNISCSLLRHGESFCVQVVFASMIPSLGATKASRLACNLSTERQSTKTTSYIANHTQSISSTTSRESSDPGCNLVASDTVLVNSDVSLAMLSSRFRIYEKGRGLGLPNEFKNGCYRSDDHQRYICSFPKL